MYFCTSKASKLSTKVPYVSKAYGAEDSAYKVDGQNVPGYMYIIQNILLLRQDISVKALLRRLYLDSTNDIYVCLHTYVCTEREREREREREIKRERER